MLRFLSSIAVVLCILGYVKTDPVLTVTECIHTEVTFSITGGVSGGITFVEGTSGSNGCAPTLAGDASDIFIMNFGTCGVTPTSNLDGDILTFVIIIQENSVINTITDVRYKVECTFGEASVFITATLKTVLTDPIGFIPHQFNNQPQPKMELFYRPNGTQVLPDHVLQLGTEVQLVISMAEELPYYNVIAEECTITAEDLAGIHPTVDVDLLSSSGCSVMETVFPSFTYSVYQFLDSTDTPFDASILTSDFAVFTPTLWNLQLSQQNVLVNIRCKVRICLLISCVEPTCPAPARRKRQTNQTPDESVVYDLQDSFRVSYGSEVSSDPKNDVTSVHVGENNVCMDSASFYGMLISLLALLIAALSIFFCFCLCVRRRRRRKQSKTSTLVESYSSKVSASTPVEANIMSKPVNTITMALPRYFPAERSNIA